MTSFVLSVIHMIKIISTFYSHKDTVPKKYLESDCRWLTL
jgi:hypothetical protein